MSEFESMQSMAKRLAGTGGGSQADAVINGINAINGAPGMLDAQNRAVALYHLSVALSGSDHAIETLENAVALATTE